MPPFRQARPDPGLRADLMSTFALGPMQVRRSGYGAMQLAGPFAFGTPPDRVSAIGVLRAAVAAGVDHIDTAQYCSLRVGQLAAVNLRLPGDGPCSPARWSRRPPPASVPRPRR